jgi:NodT family efflux transporter outer membrane factor (OMF) lipoprotein
MTATVRFTTLGAILLLGACATQPAPERAQIADLALPALAIPGEWSGAAAEGRVPDGWLTTFGDPVLEALVGEALQNNLDLRGTATRLERARAEAESAGAGLRPVVGAAGRAGTREAADTRFESRGAGLKFSWELDVWGRIRNEVDAAGEAVQASEADLEFARQSLAAAVAKGWFLATETRAIVGLLESEQANREEMGRITTVRREAGRASMEDVHLVNADIARTAERLAAARNAHQQALRALEVLLGRYPGAELESATEFGPLPAPVPGGVPSDLLERRPDLIAAEARVRAAFRRTEAARLARMPSFTLTGGAGAAAPGAGFFSVAANFFAPLLDGGRTDAALRIATAEQEAALVAYGQTALRAFQDVENTVDAEATLLEREAQVTRQVDELREALRLRRLEAEAGKADTLSVLQVQSQVDAAEASLRSLQQGRRSERVNLHLALGGGFN